MGIRVLRSYVRANMGHAMAGPISHHAFQVPDTNERKPRATRAQRTTLKTKEPYVVHQCSSTYSTTYSIHYTCACTVHSSTHGCTAPFQQGSSNPNRPCNCYREQAHIRPHPVLTRTTHIIDHASAPHGAARAGSLSTPTRRPGHGHPLPRPPVSTSWRRHSASVSKPITRTSAHWPSAHKRSCGQRPAFPGISGGASATRRGAMGGRWHAREVVSSRRVASPTVARARERERLGRDKG